MRNFSLSPSTPGIAPLDTVLADKANATGDSLGQTAETFGAKLSRLRKMRGWTQSDLAQKLGVTEASVCYWEQDRSRPKAVRLQSLATLLDMPVAELLGHAAPGRANLGEMVARMRAEIAQAAGISPSKVKIVIEM